MRSSDYLTAQETINVAEAEATGSGAALLAAARREYRRVQKALSIDAKVNCERVEDDIRYHLGMMRGLVFLERLCECARRDLGMTVDGNDKEL